MTHETLQVERFLRSQEVIGDTTEFVGEDGESLAGTMAALNLRQTLLHSFIPLRRQHSGFGEGPLEPGVAGPRIPDTDDLAGRLLLRGDELGVAAELLAAVEAFDRVDFEQVMEMMGPTPGMVFKAASSVANCGIAEDIP